MDTLDIIGTICVATAFFGSIAMIVFSDWFEKP
jgi:hypothetical protein